MAKTNADFFGQPKYFTISFKNSDLYFFLLSKFGQKGILAIQIVQPYEHEVIVSKVNEYLTDRFIGRAPPL